MGRFENLSIRRYLLTLVIVLTTLAGGTTIVIKTTTDHLLYREATEIAQRWAQFLADNVTDLEKVTPLDLSEFDAVAAESVKREIPIVDAKQGQTAGERAYFAQAYVPIVVRGQS